MSAAAFRSELRLAARQTRKAWAVSILVVALVFLPLMIASALAVFISSRFPTGDEFVRVELGQTASRFEIVGAPNPSRSQDLAGEYWDDGKQEQTDTPLVATPAGFLPDTPLLYLADVHVKVRTPGGPADILALIGDVGDERLNGRIDLLEGRRASDPEEATISPGAAKRLASGVGDRITLLDPEDSVVIVGITKSSTESDDLVRIFLPGDSWATPTPTATTWFTPEWQPTDDDLPALNQAGIVAHAHDLLLRSEAYPTLPKSILTAFPIAFMTLISLGAIGYFTAVLCRAGFAVSARRQYRALALISSIGASRRTVFRVILLQGAVLGTIGGLLGILAGLGLGALILPVFDDGAAQSYWGYHPPWWILGSLLLFATLIGSFAALSPARTAARNDPLTALRRSRRPPEFSATRPLIGVALMIVGLAITAIGALALSTIWSDDSTQEPNAQDPRVLLSIVIIGGPILFQLGVILSCRWMLGKASALLSYFSVSARLASRDLAMNPGRVVPAFAAIAASAFLASLVISSIGIFVGKEEAGYLTDRPPHTISLYLQYPSAEGAPEDPAGAARALLSDTGADHVAAVADASFYGFHGDIEDEKNNSMVAYPERAALSTAPCKTTSACTREETTLLSLQDSRVLIINPNEAEAFLGPLPAQAQDLLTSGGALTTDAAFLRDGQIRIRAWRYGDLATYADQQRQSNADGRRPSIPTAAQVTDLTGAHVELPWRALPTVIISPTTAKELEIETAPSFVIAAWRDGATIALFEELSQLNSAMGNTGFSGMSAPASPPPDRALYLWLALAASSTIVIAAAGIALGISRVERRPDDATLTAVGGAPRIRRWIAWYQALIIVGLGTIVGTIAGVFPAWGITLPQGPAYQIGDTPWPWLALLALGLPVLIALVNALAPNRHPELARRETIA